MNDPFSVLGISQSASEDEIKSAYRKLAKKYHPDVNNGSADSEAKMKEINEAYAEALKIKRSGGTYRPGGQSTGGYGGQSYYGQQQGAYRNQDYGNNGYGRQDDGFGFGFGGFDFGDFGFGNAYRNANQQSSSPELNAARNYINTGHYNDALNMLQRTNERSAEWFYLSARANLGLGNRTAALTYARQAAQLDPDNYEYARLLSNLEGNSDNYRRQGASFGGIPIANCTSNPCLWCCMLNCFCNCLRRFFFC